MCEFISWVERRDKVYFLTGKQLFHTKKGQRFIETISPDDYCGHGTIRAYYGIDTGDGIDKECTDFSSPNNFPIQVAKAIKNGDFKGFSFPGGLLRKLLEDDYLVKRRPLDDDYEAKRKLLYDDYWAKRKPLEDDYLAKLKLLDDDYEAKRKPLYDDYWDLFTKLENRNPAWR